MRVNAYLIVTVGVASLITLALGARGATMGVNVYLVVAVGVASLITLAVGGRSGDTCDCNCDCKPVIEIKEGCCAADEVSTADKLTARDIAIIQGQWAKVVEKLGLAGVGMRVIKRIFELAPQSLGNFFGDIELEGPPYDETNTAMLAMATLIGKNLNNMVMSLGKTDIEDSFKGQADLANEWGLEMNDAQKQVIGEALFDLVRHVLGDNFNTEAWTFFHEHASAGIKRHRS